MKHISLLVLAYLLRAATAYGDGLSRTVQCVNNTNTDTGAINTAINDVCDPSANGGDVFILPGTCLINPHVQTFSLCNNLTIRGAGPKSFLQVAPNIGTYSTIFGGRTSFPVISNVVIKDFRIDQNPIGNPSPPGGNEGTGLHVIDLSVSLSAASGVTVSGMFFDAVDGMHAIHLESGSSNGLKATITNNVFNFNKAGTSIYDNTAVYLEGSQQVVTGNTFLSTPPTGTPLSQYAGVAVETRGGPSTVSNNTTNYYATLVNIVRLQVGTLPAPPIPNDIVVSNNSVTNAQTGISMWGPSTAGQALLNVAVTGNTIHIDNVDRSPPPTAHPNFAGVLDASPGDVDSLTIGNNIIVMQPTQAPGGMTPSAVGGILLTPTGSLSNILVIGNIVTNSPLSGIRVFSSAGSAQRVRIIDNTIVDAGNDSGFSSSTDKIYRHAIGINGVANDIDIQRNMIYDTGAPSGVYSLYLQPVAPSVNVRTSQNTVRVAGSGPPLLAPQSTNGQLDTTSSGDVLTSPVSGGGTLSPDFMSFSRYVTTLGGDITVANPRIDTQPANLYFTHGQVVTFRFICNNGSASCGVTFSTRYAMNGSWAPLSQGGTPIPANMGRAISFQAEVPQVFGTPANFYFFEVSRSADIPNP